MNDFVFGLYIAGALAVSTGIVTARVSIFAVGLAQLVGGLIVVGCSWIGQHVTVTP